MTTASLSDRASGRRYVFVCYAHDERAVVLDQIRWLRDDGFDVWFDEAIEAGNRWSEDLARAVEGCAAVLYFLSPRSATSRYCLDEIHFALECGRPIVPAEIEPVTLTPGLRLSLGGTHRIFMYRLGPEEFRRKLASGLRAAIDGTPAPTLHSQSPAQPPRDSHPPATTDKHFDWRPLAVGALVAIGVFAAILLS